MEERVLDETLGVRELKTVEREEMQPTLLIGLGGTGKIVLTRLKARFIENFGKVPPTIKLLLFDIDPKVETTKMDTQEITLSSEEFIDIGNVPVGDIKVAMRQGKYPELRDWFNKDISLAEDNLRRGGQQNRQLGRLALFWHLRTRGGIEYIENAISELTRQAVAARHGQPDSDRPLEVNVLVISSLCGGTGSGMFLDVAYLTQHLFQARGMKDTSRIIGIFITPKIFRSVLQENIQPNGLASLQELDYFMGTKPDQKKFRTIRYLGGMEVPCVERPFRVCYLIDAISSGGRNIEGIENATPMLVDGIFLQVGSRLGARAAGLINNVKVFDPPTVYSSFGVASLLFPARQIIGICASRIGQEVIRDTLLAPLSDSARIDLNKEVGRFMDDKSIDRRHLFDRLTKNEKGASVLGRLRTDDRLRDTRLAQIDKSQIYNYVTTRVQEIGADMDNVARKQMAASRDATVKDLIDNPQLGLHQKVRELANSPEHGLNYALEFLKALYDRLDALLTDLERERSASDQRRGAAEAVRAAAQSKFEKATRDAQRAVTGAFVDLARPRGDFIDVCQKLLDLNFEVEAYVQAKQIVSGVMTEEERLSGSLKTLVGNLQWVQEPLLETRRNLFADEIVNLDAVRRKAITTSADIEKIYEEHKESARHKVIAEVMRGDGGLFELARKSREDVGKRVFAVGSQAFSHLLERRLEDIIAEKEKKDGMPIEEWMKSLRGSAETFWSYRKALDVAEERVSEFIQITGVEDTQDSIFSTKVIKVGEDYASTDDRQMITVLRMEHGLAYETMSQYDTYLTAYKRAIQKNWPVHIFPEFNYGTGREKETFVLAYAHRLITKLGTEYTYTSGKEGEKETVLSDSGLTDAVWSFVHNENLVQRVEEQVKSIERAAAKENKVALIQGLQEFANGMEFEQRDEIIGQELKRLLLAHVERLKHS